jgi:hypothetical protein
VKNYRAEETLTPTPSGGTSIRWAATWDKTFLGRIVRCKLQQVYPEVVNALVAAGRAWGGFERRRWLMSQTQPEGQCGGMESREDAARLAWAR